MITVELTEDEVRAIADALLVYMATSLVESDVYAALSNDMDAIGTLQVKLGFTEEITNDTDLQQPTA